MTLFRQGNRKKSTPCTPLIWHPQAPDQGRMGGALLSVSLPEERHERRTFCRRSGNPRTCNNGSAIDSIPKEAFAESFQKLYECCQQCVVKDGNYFEGQ
jgi:hypothetical protein